MTIPQDNYFMLFFPHHSFFLRSNLCFLTCLDSTILDIPVLTGVSSPSETLHKGLYQFDDSGNVSVALCSVWLYLLCFVAVVLVHRISFHALFLSMGGWDSSWDLYSAPLVRLSWFFGPMEVDLISSWRILIISWEDFSSLMSSSRWSFIIQHFAHTYFRHFHYNFDLQSECKYYVVLLPTPSCYSITISLYNVKSVKLPQWLR